MTPEIHPFALVTVVRSEKWAPEPTSEDLHPSGGGPIASGSGSGRPLSIPLDEVEWRATTSGGPAASTPTGPLRVEVRFDWWRRSSARATGPPVERIGPVVRAAPVRTAHRPGTARSRSTD